MLYSLFDNASLHSAVQYIHTHLKSLVTKYFILLNNIITATTKQTTWIYCFLCLYMCSCTCAPVFNDRYCLFNIHVQVKVKKRNKHVQMKLTETNEQTNKHLNIYTAFKPLSTTLMKEFCVLYTDRLASMHCQHEAH